MATSSTDQRPQPSQPDDGEVVSPMRARQGPRDRRMLWVLLGGLALLLIAYLIAYAISPTAPAAPGPGAARVDDPAAAELFQAPAPAPIYPADSN